MQLHEFKYKRGVLIRSALVSWRPGKWPLGPGARAIVAAGPPRLLLNSPMFLTVTTPDGDALVIEAWGRKDAARAHRMAARINHDAALSPVR